MVRTWLVTGCSSGLGLAIAETVLERGDRLTATARNLPALEHLRDQYRDRIHLFELDVRAAITCQTAVDETIRVFGNVDVLVNNAGYARAAPFEQTTANDFNDEIDANFFGVVNMTRAALPFMRKRGSGTVLNISSSAGRVAAAGTVAYCAAKFAVSGFSEALAKEVGPLGIKVVSIEPGSLRTNWTSSALANPPDLLPEYERVIGPNLRFGRNIVGQEPGDPQKCAKIIYDLTLNNELPQHLVLGSDAVERIDAGERARALDAAKWLAVSQSVGFDD
jgi:NAD(P)-dependent dehydrogenase (short-subunit alcohol dehydrogenase family)